MKRLWKEFRHYVLKIVAPVVGFMYLYLVGKTSRTVVVGQERHTGLRKQYPHFIYAAWHEQILLGLWTLRRRGITVLISRSRDGEYASRLVHLMGFRSTRGSSSRGGVRGLLQLIRVLKNTGDIIIVADGPRGPAKQCKPGVILLAKHSGMPIIPSVALVNRYKRAKSWDRMIMPFPGSQFIMVHGDPIFVPEDADESTLEQYQTRVTQCLNTLIEQAEQQFIGTGTN